MSYVVLARKWRPMIFEDVVGQEHVTRTLMNALKQERIAHSYIFAGPRGVGKTTTARLLAKAVNCAQYPTVNPCNQCDSCKAITEGHSLDVIEIDGASNRGIDEIRNLRENIRFAPATSRFKIYIIDEVHMLTKEAFNALLKTLEEPPAHAIFIFATTEIHKVPLTILSRCQRFDFKRIPTSQIAEFLKKIVQTEKIKADDESLFLIARKAEGSMRDAESILDQLISFSNGEITVDKVRESLGLISEEIYFEFTNILERKDSNAALDYARKIFQQGIDLMDYFYGLQEHFRNLLITRTTQSAKLLDTSDEFKKLYEEKAPLFTEKDLLHYLDLLAGHEQMLKFSPNPQLILELLLLKLIHKPLAADLEELLSLLKEGNFSSDSFTATAPSAASSTPPAEKKTAEPSPGQPSPTPRAVKEPGGSSFDQLKKVKLPGKTSRQNTSTHREEEKPLNISLEAIKEKWEQIVEAVRQKKIALGSFLQDGVPYQLSGRFLEIAFDPKTRFHQNHVQKNSAVIEDILKNEFQIPVRIRCVEVDFQKAGIQRRIHTPEEILQDVKEKEPVLKKIIELFDCEEISQ